MSEVKKYRRVLGLDLGISSVGWAITDHELISVQKANESGEVIETTIVNQNSVPNIVSFGTRIFKIAEDGDSSNTKLTREFRAVRRRKERMLRRINRIKYFFAKALSITVDDLNKKINEIYRKGIDNGKKIDTNNEQYDPMKLRISVLEGKQVSTFQLLIICLQFAKHRGYKNMFNEDEQEKTKVSKPGEVKTWNERVNNSFPLIEKYKYPSLAINATMKSGYADGQFDNNTFAYRNGTKRSKNDNAVLWQREQLKSELIEILRLSSSQAFLTEKVKVNTREFPDGNLIETKDAIIEIIYAQRYFEEGPGPFSGSVKRENWKNKFINKNKDGVVNQNLSRQLKEDFTTKVEQCSLIDDQKRAPKFSVLTDLLVVANKVSVMVPYSGIVNQTRNATKEELEIAANERNQSNLHRIEAMKIAFDYFLENGIFEIKEFKERVVLKNVFDKSTVSKFNSIADSIETQAGHDTLKQLMKLNLPSINKYKEEFINIFNSGNIEDLENSKLETLTNLLWTNVTPQRRIEQLEIQFPELISEFESSKMSIYNDVISKLNLTIEKNASKPEKKSLVENLKLKIQNESVDVKDTRKYLQKTLAEITANGTQLFSKKASIQLLQIALEGKHLQIEISKLTNEAIKRRAKASALRIDESKPFWKRVFKQPNDQNFKSNVVVFRAVNEARKIVKDIVIKYGQIDQVVLEVASEIFKSKDDRNRIRSEQDKNAKQWIEIAKRLGELGIANNEINRNKYYLYTLQGNKDVITDKLIGNDREIFTNEYQIDHIIPYSKVNDNSLTNKILLTRKQNQDKGDRTIIKWLEDLNTDESKKAIKRIQAMATKIIDTKTETVTKKAWAKNLLIKDYEDVQMSFVKRNINDTRYITKYLSSYLTQEFENYHLILNAKNGTDFKTDLIEINGKLTSNLRRTMLSGSAWGNDKKVRDITPFHHAVDAIIMSQIHSIGYAALLSDRTAFVSYARMLAKGDFNANLPLSEKVRKLTWFKNEMLSRWRLMYRTSDPYLIKLFGEYSKSTLDDSINESYLSKLEDLTNETEFENIVKKFNVTFENEKNHSIFANKIENLLPVRLELVKATEGASENTQIPKFVSVVSPEDWSKLNDLSQDEYPFISYKPERKFKGVRRIDSMVPKNKNSFKPGEYEKAIKDSVENPNTKFLIKKSEIKSGEIGNIFMTGFVGIIQNEEGVLNNNSRLTANMLKASHEIKYFGYNDSIKRMDKSDIVQYVRFTGTANNGAIVLSPNLQLTYTSEPQYKSQFNLPSYAGSSTNKWYKIEINRLGKSRKK